MRPVTTRLFETSSTPAAYALSFLARFSGLVVSYTAYMATLTNRHDAYSVQQIEAELALRGRNPALLP